MSCPGRRSTSRGGLGMVPAEDRPAHPPRHRPSPDATAPCPSSGDAVRADASSHRMTATSGIKDRVGRASHHPRRPPGCGEGGLVSRNVALVAHAPRLHAIPKVEPQAWTAQQLQAFLQAAASHRLFPAFWALAATGMRRSEQVQPVGPVRGPRDLSLPCSVLAHGRNNSRQRDQTVLRKHRHG